MPTLNRLKNAIVPFLIALLVVFLAAFAGVRFSECTQGLSRRISWLVRKKRNSEISGIRHGWRTFSPCNRSVSHRRAKAMEDAANAQAGATAEQAKAQPELRKGASAGAPVKRHRTPRRRVGCRALGRSLRTLPSGAGYRESSPNRAGQSLRPYSKDDGP